MDGKIALVDPEDWLMLHKLRWKSKKGFSTYYAKTLIDTPHGKKSVYMHRVIMRTPTGMVCHHKNGNGLYNLKINLENMNEQHHNFLTKSSKIRECSARTPTPFRSK
jgi:hypothetical protein